MNKDEDDSSKWIWKSTLFGGGGLLIAYVSHQLYTLLFPSSHSKSRIDPSTVSTKQLVDLTFPFSFILTTSNEVAENKDGDSIRVDFDYVDHLLEHLQKDTNNCYVAVYEAMLFNKIYRLLFSGEHDPTDREIHTGLWILLHCLLKLNSHPSSVTNVQSLFLQIFTLSDFFQFLQEAALSKQKARVLFQSKVGEDTYKTDIFPAEAFKHKSEVVWLAFAIVAQFYVSNSSVLVHVKKSKRIVESVADKHLILLKSNKDLLDQLTFEPSKPAVVIQKFPFDKSNTRYARNEVTVESSSTGEIALRIFDKFLALSNKLMNCDEMSLVQLALTSFGQLCTSCNSDMLDFILYEQKSLHIISTFSRLTLCDEPTILQTLAKCIFTISMKDREYLTEKLMQTPSLVNEVIHISIFTQVTDHTNILYNVQLQFLNVLYLMLIHSESLCVQLIQSKQVNLLNRISAWLQAEQGSLPISSQNLTFSALQLLYGVSQHGVATQDLVVAFHTKQKRKQESAMFQQLKRLTFSTAFPLFRYYSLLIWGTFIASGKYKRFLSKNEQLLNVLVFVLKEEQELVIKRLAVQLLRQLCTVSGADQTEDAGYELMMLLNHFNLLFECVELLRFHMTFLASHFAETKKLELEGGLKTTVTREDREKYVRECVQFVIAIFFLLATCANENQEARELLVSQYEINLYVGDLLQLLKVEVKDDMNYNRVLATAQNVFNYNDVNDKTAI